MKILYLQMFPLHGSGSGTYARELAQEVSKRHSVAMVAPEKENVLKGVKIYPIKLSVKIAFTGHPQWPDCRLYTNVQGKELAANYLSYFDAVIDAINDFDPDIIHVHHLMPLSWIARFVKIAYGLNFIATAHGSELPTLEKDKRYPYLTLEALTKSVRIAPNSYWTKEWMLKALLNSNGNIKRKIKVIPGGIDLSNFPKEMNTQNIDEKYRLEGKNLVMFSGKLTEYKGVKYLIQAARDIDAIIGITGDGPERENLEKLVKDMKLKNVRFFGYINGNELLSLYYRAQVCVVPSVWDEPLGLVVLEAMAAYTPVVVTRKGGIPLMVKENHNGLFVRPRNSKQIAEKVNYLLKNDELRIKMGERARKTVEDKFTWELIAKKYERMYLEYRRKPQSG